MVQALVYNDSGFKGTLARNINENLVALGFEDKGVVERPNLVVLKRTKMPAVLLELGFINSDKDNQLFDEKFNEIAQAIADGIIDTLNSNGITASQMSRYTVQVGAFRNPLLANRQANELKMQGFPVNLIVERGLIKVTVGNYRNLDNAVATEQRLRALGYNTFVRTI